MENRLAQTLVLFFGMCAFGQDLSHKMPVVDLDLEIPYCTDQGMIFQASTSLLKANVYDLFQSRQLIVENNLVLGSLEQFPQVRP